MQVRNSALENQRVPIDEGWKNIFFDWENAPGACRSPCVGMISTVQNYIFAAAGGGKLVHDDFL
jgi:hypothetical protein